MSRDVMVLLVWDWFWGAWWSTIDWGNAAAWVSSVLSAVTTFLALRLIWTARRQREDAQALAQAVRISRDVEDGFLGAVRLYVFNGSDAPLPAVTFVMETRTGEEKPRPFVQDKDLKTGARAVAPKVEGYRHFGTIEDVYATDARVWVYFRDADNRVWKKDMQSRRLKRMSRRFDEKNADRLEL